MNLNDTIRHLHESSTQTPVLGPPDDRERREHDINAGSVLGDALDEADLPGSPFFRNLVRVARHPVTATDRARRLGTYISGDGQYHSEDATTRRRVSHHAVVRGRGPEGWRFVPVVSDTGVPKWAVDLGRHHPGGLEGPLLVSHPTHTAILGADGLREWAGHPKVHPTLRHALIGAAAELDEQVKPSKLARPTPKFTPQRLVAAGIRRWQDFTPTEAAPSPGRALSDKEAGAWFDHTSAHGSHTSLDDFHDVSAVLAGRKPAAWVSGDWASHPVGQEQIRQARARGLAVRQWGEHAAIGHPDNVETIQKASALGDQRGKRSTAEHQTIGTALGYPAQSVLDWGKRTKLARNENKQIGTGSATRMVDSDNHRKRVALAQQVLAEAGLTPSTVKAVLSHSDARGVRPAVSAFLGGSPDPRIVRFAAAWMGLLTGERKVTTFHPGEGEDYLHVIDSPHESGHVGDYLRRAGVPSFTLESRGAGTRVYVVAPMDLLDVKTAANGLGGTHAAIRGTATRLGGGSDSQAESRAAFRQVIDDAQREAGL